MAASSLRDGVHQRTGGFTFCTFCTYGALFQGAHPRSQEQVCRLLGPVFLLLFLMYGGINEIRKFACLPVLRQWKLKSAQYFLSWLLKCTLFSGKVHKVHKVHKVQKVHLCTSEHFCVVCFYWKHYWWTFVLKVQKVYKVHRVHSCFFSCALLCTYDVLNFKPGWRIHTRLARRTIKAMVIWTPPHVYLSYKLV